MSQKSNVIKLVQPSPSFSEDAVLLQNYAQILLEVTRRHGAKTTLDVTKQMIQDAQSAIRTEKKFKEGA